MRETVDLLRWLRPHPLTRRDSERLLDGAPDDAHDGVANLLAAAAAPARPGELSGEDAAVAAFRRAYRPASSSSSSSSSAALSPAGLLLKRSRVAVVALGAVVALVGGTAYAAGTSRLPDPVQRELHEAFAGIGVPPPDQRDVGSPTQPPPSPSVSPAESAPVSSPARDRLVALCRTWQASRDTPGAPQLRPDERKQLADAAGGPNRIAQFCAGLAATPAPGTTTPGTTAPGKPGGPPATPPGQGNGNGNGPGNNPGNNPGNGNENGPGNGNGNGRR